MTRVTHKHISDAVARYNAARGLTYPSIGYLQYADIRGDGSNWRGLYVQINEGGGVGSSYAPRKGKTMRETLANIDEATRLYKQFDKAKSFAVIINAIHERGARQIYAMAELNRRGLWLNEEQKRQAATR